MLIAPETRTGFGGLEAELEAFYRDRYNDQFRRDTPLAAAAVVAEFYQDNPGQGFSPERAKLLRRRRRA